MLQDAWRASDGLDAVAGIEFDIAWHTLLVESARNPALLRTWSMAGLSNLIWCFEFDLYPLDDISFKSWVLRHVEFPRRAAGPRPGRLRGGRPLSHSHQGG